MIWSDAYIGLPYARKGRDRSGVDCFGLIRMVLQMELGIEIAPFLEPYASDVERAEIAAALRAETALYPWQPVERADAREFDGVLFHRGGVYDHVGIVVERGVMLHVRDGSESCLASYDEAPWAARFVGIYRHREWRPSAQ